MLVRMRSTKMAKTAQNDWRDVGQPQVTMHSQLLPFLVFSLTTLSYWQNLQRQKLFQRKCPSLNSPVSRMSKCDVVILA